MAAVTEAGQEVDRAAQARDLARAIACVSLAAAVWLLMHPYYGILHDTRIYLGFALAKLHPETIGQDLMFTLDGQGEFSVFPLLLVPLVKAFGAQPTAVGLTIGAVVAWFAAAMVLIRTLAPPGLRWAAFLFLALASSAYGAFRVFHYAEVMATPRPFAEAAALFAIAALLTRRWALALAGLVASTLLHPIMAAPAWGVALVLLIFHDRRWLAVIPVGAVGLIGLAGAGFPPADRLFQLIDPEWRAVLDARAVYLFPTQWPSPAWSKLIVHMATAALGAGLLRGRLRDVLLAALIVAVGGMTASLLFGDLAPSVLVAQLQTWRAQWLLAVAAAVSLPFVLLALADLRTPGANIALGALVLAWASATNIWLVATALLLLAAALLLQRRGFQFTAWHVRAVWAYVAVVVGTTWVAGVVTDIRQLIGGWVVAELQLQALVAILVLPALAVATLLLLRRKSFAPDVRWLAAACLVLVPAALMTWNRNSEEPRIGLTAEQHLLPAGVGPDETVLWLWPQGLRGQSLGEIERWQASDRPQWFATVQGSGTIFSRELALEWDRRARLLLSLGLKPDTARLSWHAAGDREWPVAAHATGLRAICATPGGPRLVVVSFDSRYDIIPPGSQSVVPLAQPERQLMTTASQDLFWRYADRLAVYDCRQSWEASSR